MTEVVESGRPDRPKRGWAVGLAAVLLLAAGVYGATRPRPRPEEARPAPTTAPASVPPLETFDPDPPGGDWVLPPLEEPTGIAYAMSGPVLRVLDVDEGDATDLTQPRPGGVAAVDPVARVGDAWVVLTGVRCGRPACASRARLVRGQRSTDLGPAEAAFPDGEDAVWLSAAGADATYRTPRWLERRSLDGRRTGPRTALRRAERLLGATPLGALVADPAAPSPTVYAIDRAGRRREVLEQAHVLSVAGAYVAWTSTGCREEPVTECALTVSELTTGRTTVFDRLLAVPATVALSPSGRYVAVAPGADEPAGAPVVVYDRQTHATLRVGGVTHPPGVTALAWSPDSRWLVAVGPVSPRHFGRQAAVWRPGLPTAYEGVPLPPAEGEALVVVAAS